MINPPADVQKYWITLGGGMSRDIPYYPQSLLDSQHWREYALRASESSVVIRVEFNPLTGEAFAFVEKNESQAPVQEEPTDAN